MSKKHLSIGKYRALQRASTADGKFTILAIDHQDALRRALNPASPDDVTDDELIAFKRLVVGALINDVSGVLLDPLYGAFQAIADNTLLTRGLLVELEKADYQMNPLPLDVEIDPAWNVSKIKHMGADGVKLFFYYNPFKDDHARRQDAIVRNVATDCDTHDIPFYAEPIIYDTTDKTGAVVASAKRVESLGADVLKLEFPVDVNAQPDESVWLEACQAITDVVAVPWVLLSAGVSFEMFARQLEIACKAGASGFIVGRALWGDVAGIDGVETRLNWLRHTGRDRLQQLNTIVNTHATSWQALYELPPITTTAFRDYRGGYHDET